MTLAAFTPSLIRACAPSPRALSRRYAVSFVSLFLNLVCVKDSIHRGDIIFFCPRSLTCQCSLLLKLSSSNVLHSSSVSEIICHPKSNTIFFTFSIYLSKHSGSVKKSFLIFSNPGIPFSQKYCILLFIGTPSFFSFFC